MMDAERPLGKRAHIRHFAAQPMPSRLIKLHQEATMFLPLPSLALTLGAWLVVPSVAGSVRGAAEVHSIRSVDRVSATDTIRRGDTIVVTDSADDPASANLRAFHARKRAGGMGYFLDETRLAALHPALASEALRSIPGVVLRPTTRLVNEVRMRGCAPLVWVDGQRAVGAELDDLVRGSDVAAMEVYATMIGVPPEFADRTATCGTVLVWTRPV
jgi:hypothetical protein